MLLKDFYTVIERSGPEPEVSPKGTASEKFLFRLELNRAHPIYEGHFPGKPVVPGVCQVQMIDELVSLIRGYDLRMIYADNVKFMTLMVPGQNPVIEAEISLKSDENGEISANAVLRNGEIVFLKFKGLFRQEV